MVTLILAVSGGDPIPVLLAVVLLLFLVYALWNPPKKHKNYSLSDQHQAVSRALGGSGAPDISQLKSSKQRNYREKSQGRKVRH